MVWLIGNKGMLGAELDEALEISGIPFAGTDREVDILDPGALRSFADGKAIDWVVNCAAYTAVDKAEDELVLAAKLNAEGPENIAMLAMSIGAKFLHVSTDYVFDGTATRPYREDDPVSPLGVYGQGKAEGESRIRECCARHVIVRTAWLYGRHGANFVQTMLRLMAERDELGIVSDQQGTPTWARNLAQAIIKIIGGRETVFGTYHFTDAGETTWYDFAVEIQRLAVEYGIVPQRCKIFPLSTVEYPTRVRRPAYSVLSKDKIQEDYKVRISSWQESLSGYLRLMAKGNV